MWNLVVNQGKCSQKFELLRVCSSAQCVCVCVCERERERIQVDVEDGERLAELQGTKAQYSVCVCVCERERERERTELNHS